MTVTALYRHYDAAGVLLYVGISVSAPARLAQHVSGSHWSDQIARVEIEKHPTREAAEAAERQAIRCEGPLHNSVIAPAPAGAEFGPAKVGARMKALREALGLSQSQMAAEWGWKQGELGSWECGQRRPSVEKLVAIHAAGVLTLDWLFLGAGPAPAALSADDEAAA